MSETVPRLYSMKADDVRWLASQSGRVQALVRGSLAYNSLIQPGRTLLYRLYMGERWQYPRLTDTSTLNGQLTEDAGLTPVREFEATSIVRSKTEFSPHYFAGNSPLIDRNVRDILLTPDDATDDDVERRNPDLSFAHRLYHQLEEHTPIAFDAVLDFNRSRRWRKGLSPIKPSLSGKAQTVNLSGDSHHPWIDIVPGHAGQDARPAVIVALHWLQPGGAERWGIETVRLVREAGFLPIVLTDIDSHQPWITRPELEGALVIPLTQPLQERVGDAPLLRALFEQFDIRGILIHHCQWMYDRCWWVKRYFPQTTIIDSLHIVEYRYQGGYPAEAVRHDQWIDFHHVISPQVRDWLVKVHHIRPDKVFMAPLVDLTADEKEDDYKLRVSPETMTVAFVGRMARQKRPDTFLAMAALLHHEHPGKYRFILQGSGDLDSEVTDLVNRFGLAEVTERRSIAVPVAKTYADADVLVISSANEGLTLTTMEALAAGIPVISTNVGSQYTLVPSRALMPRTTALFTRSASRAIEGMRAHEGWRHGLWLDEERKLRDFAANPSAEKVFARILGQWKAEKNERTA